MQAMDTFTDNEYREIPKLHDSVCLMVKIGGMKDLKEGYRYFLQEE